MSTKLCRNCVICRHTEQEGRWQPWKFTAVYHHKDPGVVVTHLIVKLGPKLEVILLWFTCKILIFQQTDSSYWDGCFSTVEKWGAALADSPWSSVWAQSTVAGVHVCIVFEYLSGELVSFPDSPPKGSLGTRLVLSQLIWRNSWLSRWPQRASNIQCRHRFRYRQTLTCNPVATFSWTRGKKLFGDVVVAKFFQKPLTANFIPPNISSYTYIV